MSRRADPPSGYLGVNRMPTRREWRRALLLFAVGIVGLILVLLFVRPKASLLAVGAPAPAVSLEAAGGGHVDIPGAAAGRPYILEFFGAACPHCQEAAGHLCNQRVPVFAIDAEKESAQAISAYGRQYAPQCRYPMLLDPALSAASAFAVNAVPTVYLVKDGRIAYAGSGVDGVNGLDGAVQRALGG